MSSPSEKAHQKRMWSERLAKEYLLNHGFTVKYDHGDKASNLPLDIIAEKDGKLFVFDVKSHSAFEGILKAPELVRQAMKRDPDALGFMVIEQTGEVHFFMQVSLH